MSYNTRTKRKQEIPSEHSNQMEKKAAKTPYDENTKRKWTTRSHPVYLEEKR